MKEKNAAAANDDNTDYQVSLAEFWWEFIVLAWHMLFQKKNNLLLEKKFKFYPSMPNMSI